MYGRIRNECYGDELKQLEGCYSGSSDEEYVSSEEGLDENGEDNEQGEDESEEFDLSSLYCVACDKMFKTEGARQNHDNSKKHKDNIERLRAEMMEEDGLLLQDTQSGSEMECQPEEGIQVTSKNKKKKNKNKSKGMPVPKTLDSGDSSGSNGDCNENVEDLVIIEDTNKEVVEEVNNVETAKEVEKPKSKRTKKKGKKNKLKEEVTEKNEEIDQMVIELNSDSDFEVGSKKKMKSKSKKKETNKWQNSVEIPSPQTLLKDDTSSISTEKLNFSSKHPQEGLNLNVDEEITIIRAEPSAEIATAEGVKDQEGAKDHTCASCGAKHSSKNKLFSHLKTTGHSILLPKNNSEPVKGKKKKKSRKNDL